MIPPRIVSVRTPPLRRQRPLSCRPRSAPFIQPLEARVLLCSAVSDLAPAPGVGAEAIGLPPVFAAISSGDSPPTDDRGLPLLHSLPGSRAAVFLDFDGYRQYAPFDTDGDPDTFNSSEQADIREAWRHVASYFSMFDVDVTTEQPWEQVFSYSLISNTVQGSYNVGSFPSFTPTNFDQANDARYRQSALAHEIGHSFGLSHQSDYDAAGNKTNEYSAGYDRLHAPLMGSDLAGDVHKWFIGHPNNSASDLQDDVAAIAAKLTQYGGGDGFRADDTPGSVADARPMNRDGATGVQWASGVIERMGDADAYSFTVSGDGSLTLDVVPPAPSMLDAMVEVHDSEGTLVAAADSAANDQHLAFPRLPAGNYVAVIKGHGNYADLGPYDLMVTGGGAAVEDPPHNNLSAPDRPALAPAAGGGTGIDVGWNGVAGAGGYVVERSADGVVWEPAAETGAGVLEYQDPILPGGGGHRYFYRVSAKDASGVSKASAVASVVNRPDAPGELSVTTAGPSTLILNWRDVSGETGYRIERALGEGGDWAVLANVGQNVPSFADKDLGSGRPYRYRIVATGAGGDDSLPVEVGATTPFTAVDRFVVSALQPRRVALRWDPILDAAPDAYVVERSDAGGAFRAVATVSEPRWTDDSLLPLRRYRYRVVGTNVWGKSATSTTISLLAPREEPVPAPWRRAEVNTAIGGDDNLDRATGAITAVAGGVNTGDYDGFGAKFDSFRFIYQPLLRDGTITVRVVSQDSSPRRAMAGVMVRQSLDPSSPYIFAGMSPMYGEATQQRRDPGGFAQMISTQVAPGAWWFRLVVTGGSVTAYASPTGSNWAPMWGSSLALGFEPLYIGLATTSGSTADLTTTVFDRLTVSNRAPWVESPAYASPTAVTELTTELSFEASDDHGPEDLKYTWSATQLPGGADPPTFSANGTNAAKVVTATFSRAGTYVFTGRATDAQGLSISSQVRVEVTPVASKAFALPAGRAVAAGGTLQLSGTVVDQFGDELAQPPPAEWTSNYGAIDENGLYTAAPQIYDDAITGWFPTDSGWMWDTVDVHVVGVAAGAPTLQSAVSRKVHGRAGAVDLPLPLAGGRPAVEPRLGGPTTLRFTFSEPVRLDRNEDQDGVLDADDFALRNAQFVSATFEAGGAALTLVMKPLHPGRVVTVSLLRLIDADGTRLAGDNDVSVVGLFGDADRNGAVTPADLLAVRRKLGGRVRTTDLWLDLDLNGVVNALDLAHAKRRQGFALLDNPPGGSPA